MILINHEWNGGSDDMIWKPIQDYSDFAKVISMPEGVRKRRTLIRLKNRNPIAYDSYMTRWTQEHESEKPKRRSRRKQS